MSEFPAIQVPTQEITIVFDPDKQAVLGLKMQPEQIKTVEMALMILEGARLYLQTLREQALANARMQQLLAAQQELALRQRLARN